MRGIDASVNHISARALPSAVVVQIGIAISVLVGDATETPWRVVLSHKRIDADGRVSLDVLDLFERLGHMRFLT